MIIFSLLSITTLAMEYKEAPILEEKVNKGELPAVKTRLPEKPVIVEPEDEIGKYGGEIRIGLTRMGYVVGSFLGGRFSDQTPFTWNKSAGELKPNWVSDFQISEDGKTCTIQIRKGIKWSDGEPVTTDDLDFTYKNYVLNEELNPEGPPAFLDKVLEYEKVDKYTYKFHFSESNPLFKYSFTPGKFGPGALNIAPKHYMKQFHINYTSKDKLDNLVEEEGFEDWAQLFDDKIALDNIDRPVLHMWKAVEVSSDTVIAERNPFYWKVDTEGNQLPYIDRVRFDILSNSEVVTMQAMAGELDFVLFHLKLNDYPTLKKNEEKGDYRTLLWDGSSANTILWFNHTYQDDEELTKFIRTPKFKKALSMSINRDEINELAYAGIAKATQLHPPEGSAIYEEEFENMYAKHNPENAKQMLDELNIVDQNGDGWRDLPSGEDLIIEVIVAPEWEQHMDVAELIQEHFENVGINLEIQSTPYDRYGQLIPSNEFQAAIWKESIIVHPLNLMRRGFEGAFVDHEIAPLWNQWINSDGEKGKEPDEEYLKGLNLFNNFRSEIDPEKRNKLAKSLWENYYENLWTIGIVQQVPKPVVVTNRVKNVPEDVLAGYVIKTPSNANNFQWFIEE